MKNDVDEEAEFAYDARLARRWKRRRIANENFKLNHSNNASRKKNFNENDKGDIVPVEEGIVDLDYEMFLNSIAPIVDGNHTEDNEGEDCNDRDDNEVEPDYKMFLDNLREDEKSCVLEVDMGNGLSVLIKYEEEDGPCTGHVIEEALTMNNSQKREITKTGRVLSSSSKRLKTESPRLSNDVLQKDKTENPRTVGSISRRKRILTHRKSQLAEKNVEVEAEELLSCLRSRHSTNGPCQEVLHSAKLKDNHDLDCDMVDESYQKFLNCLKNDGESLIFISESGQQVTYEKDVESSSDSDVIAMDNDPFSDGNCTPFVPSKSYHILMDEDSCRHSLSSAETKHSVYREKLMDLLKKPFDEMEYKDLLQKVHERKPVLRERNFRKGNGKTYVSDTVGKSFLDQYSDLAEKIQLFEMDPPKVLNVLRGFFYWMIHLAHEEAFKPWLDPTCFEVIP